MTAALSLVSFVLAAIAYWRSGGKNDAKKLRQEVDVLRAKQKEFAESASQAVAAAFANSRQRLEDTRTHLRRLNQEAREQLQKRIKRAEEQLESLATRLEAAAQSVKNATVGAARDLEESIVRRVHRMEARARLLEAWDKAEKAVILADKQRFDDAEQLLDEAVELLRSARQTLNDDHAYDEQLDVVKKGLRTASLAVQNRAADARQKIEEVMTETDRVVCALESDEEKAAEQSRPCYETSNSPKQTVYQH
jgi:uncharacterized protein YpiB (UPF0302 family)